MSLHIIVCFKQAGSFVALFIVPELQSPGSGADAMQGNKLVLYEGMMAERKHTGRPQTAAGNRMKLGTSTRRVQSAKERNSSSLLETVNNLTEAQHVIMNRGKGQEKP